MLTYIKRDGSSFLLWGLIFQDGLNYFNLPKSRIIGMYHHAQLGNYILKLNSLDSSLPEKLLNFLDQNFLILLMWGLLDVL